MYLIWTHGTLKCDVKVLNIGPSDQSWWIPLLFDPFLSGIATLASQDLVSRRYVHFLSKNVPNLDPWDPEMWCESVKYRSKWSVLMYPIATYPYYSLLQPPGPTKSHGSPKGTFQAQKLHFSESSSPFVLALNAYVTSFSWKTNLVLPYIFRQTQATENCRC